MATQQDIASHYDLDNDFFKLFLDKKFRTYTCAVWDEAKDLEQAQVNKFERMCNFGHIAEGHQVLDVGCGWGGFMNFVSSRFKNTKCYGLTLSEEQNAHINDTFSKEKIRSVLSTWEDYQFDDAQPKFDAVICIGGLEHFATVEQSSTKVEQRKVYEKFFDWCLSVTTEEAYLGLHSIVITRLPENVVELRDTKFLLEKVFPGSALPSISDIQSAIVDKYEISAAKRIGLDYVKTLEAWKANLIAEKQLVLERYGEAIYEHYIKYFDASIRCFESGYTDLYQISLKRAKPVRIFVS